MLATKIQVHRRKDGDLTELQLESLCAAIPKILKRHGYTDARLPACTAVHLCARVMRATGVSPRNGVEQMVKTVDEIAKEEGGFYEEGEAL